MTTALDSLRLAPVGAGTFRAENAHFGDGRPVFGGQLLGQVVMAAAGTDLDKFVRSIQVMFPRTGDTNVSLDLAVRPVHIGRTMATLQIDVTQGTRRICVANALLDRDEPDVIRHAAPAPTVDGPDDAAPLPHAAAGSEVRIVGGVDLDTLDRTGPPEVALWVRWPDAPKERATNHAIAAWYTDNFLIGAAMRAHDGVGGQMAHESLSTGVVTHTITFHEPFQASEWHLLALQATHAGGGRVHGGGRVYTLSGALVASFVQDAMVRHFPAYDSRRGAASGVM
jgi:acyl-CoA thioesterase II